MSIARNGSLPLFVIFNRVSDTGAPGAPFYTKMTDKNIKKNKMKLVLSTLCLEEDLNLHTLQHEISDLACLPFHHQGSFKRIMFHAKNVALKEQKRAHS